MEILNRILDFLLSESGQLLVVAIATLITGSKLGKHFSITPKQVEKVLEKASEYKAPGKPVNTKALTKEIQRDIRKGLGGLIKK